MSRPEAIELPPSEIPVERPAGVTASAIVVIIGSALVLLIAGMIVAAPAPQTLGVPNARVLFIAAAVFLSALAALGIWTAVGLLRLRAWARTSILVFAGFTAVTCAFSMAAFSFMPRAIPPGTNATAAGAILPLLLGVYGIPLLVGVWWLIQFNSAKTKAAFASRAPVFTSRRPLDISIIGWFYLIGGIGSLVPAILGMPAFALGVVSTGWRAVLLYLFFSGISLYVGWGLLRLLERARVVGLAYLAYGAIQSIYMALSPATQSELLAYQRSMQPSAPAPSSFDGSAFLTPWLLFSAAISVLAMWLLIRNKPAFRSEETT